MEYLLWSDERWWWEVTLGVDITCTAGSAKQLYINNVTDMSATNIFVIFCQQWNINLSFYILLLWERQQFRK